MKTKLLTLFTRTPLHVGAGASVGAVDQPIVRERHTRFPVIPGSSLKGVLSSLWPDQVPGTDKDGAPRTDKKGKPVMIRDEVPMALFGSDDEKNQKGGAVAIGEAKLLAFPVRSARGCFAFVTSPICLERFKRDAGIADLSVPTLEGEMACKAGSDVLFSEGKTNAVILEEYRFANQGDFPAEWADRIAALLPDDPILTGSKKRFVLLADEDLTYFAVNACQVSQHVSIDSQTGTAAHGKLFNQEEVPSETLFYAPVTYLRESKHLPDFESRVNQETLVQFGGKGSTGIGYCSVKLG